MQVRYLLPALSFSAALLVSDPAVCHAQLGGDTLARVNGVAITKDEYLRALERVPVTVATGSGTTRVEAGRVVLDQLIGRKIVEAEAINQGVGPSKMDVERRFLVQTRLLQQQMPGVSLEAAMKQQGTTPEIIKAELRYQMAETNLLAKQFRIGDAELKKSFETYKDQIGIPARAQLRIIAPQNAEQFAQAQKLMQAKTDFTQVARQINPASLQTQAGLMGRPVPLAEMPLSWRSKVQQATEGAVLGPVEWLGNKNQPASRVWIKVERKFAAVPLSFEDALPLLKQQLVQARLADPKNRGLQKEIARKKAGARFEAADPRYRSMWEALKRATQNSLTAAAATPPSSR